MSEHSRLPAVEPRCVVPVLLKGQKALVTGANTGIGRAVALALGQGGADVVVNWHTGAEAAEETVEEIRASGVRAYAHRADVSSEVDVQRMFARMLEELGTIDILVNNAGIQQDAPFPAMTLEQWDRVLAVNLTGQFLCAREAVREFRRRGVVADVSCATGRSSASAPSTSSFRGPAMRTTRRRRAACS